MKFPVPTIDGKPVLLPAHEHCEFGTPGKHYHIDFRYTKGAYRQDYVLHSDAEPVILEMERHRESVEVISKSIQLVLWLAWQHYDQRISCQKCPHRGMPIYDGLCTGHGMAFERDGMVAKHFKLKAGHMEMPIAMYQRVITFTAKHDEQLESVELWLESGKLVARVSFESGPQFIFKGESLKVTLV